jgi:uncharacterized iron-regulated membrane protein
VSARRILIQLHLWLGLTIGLVWALQGLTGALLVFHRELDRTGVTAAAGPMVPVDPMLARVERTLGEKVTMLNVADGRGDVLTAFYKRAGESRGVRIAAATGAIVDDRPADGGWRWLYELHEELLLHDRGKTLMGVSGLVLVSAALMGLWLGWPRGRSWTLAFKPSTWRTTRQRLYGWHRMAGLLVTLALVVLPLTGAAMALGSTLRPWLAANAGFVMPHKAKGPLPADPVSPGTALAAARAVFPDARFVRLTMPSEKSPVYFVRLLQKGEVRSWSGTTAVWVDPADGRVVATYDALTAPLANRLYDAAFPLHNGEVGGLFGRLLVLLAGLSLPVLYVTGLIAWWRKRRRVSPGVSAPTSLPETAPPSPA